MAIQRINASPDPHAVLGGGVASASGLTGARYRIVATIDEVGAHQCSVCSGFTAEKQREILASPGKTGLFERACGLPRPIRVAACRATSPRLAPHAPRRPRRG